MMAAAAAMMIPAKMPALPSLSPLEIALAPPQILMIPQKNPIMNTSTRAEPNPSFTA
jgi:hypothetical protein